MNMNHHTIETEYLSEIEKERAGKFKAKHDKCYPDDQGFGATILAQYIIGTTVIGCTLDIRCAFCKEEEDITDMSLW